MRDVCGLYEHNINDIFLSSCEYHIKQIEPNRLIKYCMS